MAEARKNTERIVTVVESVAMTLSMHEAEALATILRHVSGDRKLSPRKHTEAIARALRAAGVEAYRGEQGDPIRWLLGGPDAPKVRRHADELLAKDSIGGGIRFANFTAEWDENSRG
jgi:hypothetical protein